VAFLPGSHAEFERFQLCATRYLGVPDVEQTQGLMRNLVSSRANHAGDITLHSNMALGSGSTTSSDMGLGFYNQMSVPRNHNPAAAQNIFDTEWLAYGPASTSVNDRADSLRAFIVNEPGRYYVGSLPMNVVLSRLAASTSILM